MKKELWLIFLVVFIDLLGFGIVIPTLPFVADNFGASPTQIGLLVATYSFFQFIGSPILGRLSDKYGRKPILTLSLFGSAIGYFMIAFAHTLPLLFLSRFIDGLTGGNISVAQAYIADTTKGKERTKAMGLIGASFGLGFIFGPLIGGVLSQISFAAPYMAAGTLAAINAIALTFILPESDKRSVQKKVKNLFSLSVVREALQPQIVLALTVLFFLVSLAFSLLQGVFPLFTKEVFSWDATRVGYFFAYIGVFAVFTQAVFIRKAITLVSERTLITIAVFGLSAAFIGLVAVTNIVFMFVIGALLAISFGTINTLVQSEVSNYSDPQEQGMVMGIVQGVSSLGRTIGPIIGGFLFDSVTIRTPFLLSFAILFMMGFYSIHIYRHTPQKEL